MYPAYIARIHAQLINRHPGAIDRSNGYLIGVLDQTFHHIFQKGLHKPEAKAVKPGRSLWMPF